MVQELITEQEQEKGNSRCLTDTKIPANSLVDTPDPTTKMPGINIPSYLITIDSAHIFATVWRLKVIMFALGVTDVSLDINVSTTTV